MDIKEKIRTIILDGISSEVYSFNYHKIKHSLGYDIFTKEFENKLFQINTGIGKVWDTKGYFEGGNLSISCRINCIEEIWEHLGELINIKPNDIYGRTTFSTQSKYIKSQKYDNVWIKEYDISDNGFIEYINDLVSSIPKLVSDVEIFSDIDFLDKNINSKIELNDDLNSYIISSEAISIKRIILAKMNHNPLYQDICNYERSFFKDYIKISNEKGYEYFQNIPIVFEKVYEYLKDYD